jgi:hypothetical protein
MGLDSSGVFPILAFVARRPGMESAQPSLMQRRILMLAADPRIRLLALLAISLLLAACKQGGNGGGY